MSNFGKSLVASLAVSLMAAGSAAAATSKASGMSVCSRVNKAQAAALAGAGVLAASAKAVAATAGIAALEHSSGAFILSSVGAGGTGYVAGTLGGAGATALGWLSAPVVVPTLLTGGAIVALGAGGAYAYCRYAQ